MLTMRLLYANIVKILLSKESIDTFYEVSGIYYRLEQSPLDEHRDEHVDVKAQIEQKAILLLATLHTAPR
jgi:hypothetical protein